MALRSTALIDEPAANTAAAVLTSVSLYICTFLSPDPWEPGACAPRVTVVPLTEYSPLPGVPVV